MAVQNRVTGRHERMGVDWKGGVSIPTGLRVRFGEENFLTFQVKKSRFCAFFAVLCIFCEKLLMTRNQDPLGTEDLTRTGFENLAGSSTLPNPLSTHSLRLSIGSFS